MSEIEWTEQEWNAAWDAAATVRDGAPRRVDDAPTDDVIDVVLAALAPFVAARERAAAVKALRDAEADYSHMYPSRARGVSAVAVVTCADLRDRADRIERGESS